jgi:hypothetical protein
MGDGLINCLSSHVVRQAPPHEPTDQQTQQTRPTKPTHPSNEVEVLGPAPAPLPPSVAFTPDAAALATLADELAGVPPEAVAAVLEARRKVGAGGHVVFGAAAARMSWPVFF